MNQVDIKTMAEKQNNEYVFGSADTGSHACYMIYGTLKPGEKGREIKPGEGMRRCCFLHAEVSAQPVILKG